MTEHEAEAGVGVVELRREKWNDGIRRIGDGVTVVLDRDFDVAVGFEAA